MSATCWQDSARRANSRCHCQTARLRCTSARQAKRQRPYSLRRRVRRSHFPSPSKNEGMARQAARHSFVVTPPCEGVAPLGAPSRRLCGTGPRFRRLSRPAFGSRARPLLGSRTFVLWAGRKARPSASSSRQVIVPAGGAPAAPGSLGGCVHPPPAGAASCSIIKTPLDDALTEPDGDRNIHL